MAQRTSLTSCFLFSLTFLFVGFSVPVSQPASAANCVRIEVLIRKDSPQSELAVGFLKDLRKRRAGLTLEVRDVGDKNALARAHQLLKFYKIQKPGVPIIHACGQLLVGFAGEETTGRLVENMLTIHAYTKQGCPRCGAAKVFLAKMKKQYPGFEIKEHDVTNDAATREKIMVLARRHKIPNPSTPIFHLCGQLIVGFDSEATTGARIENLLKKSSVVCPGDANSSAMPMDASHWTVQPAHFVQAEPDAPFPEEPPPDEEEPLEPLTELPLEEVEEPTIATAPVEEPPKTVDLPIFGVVNVNSIGLPLFTVAVGLVDGFNPCAMWVLLFLLSILVNLKDRRKILAVAGTFVVISGLAYFAFMAAWLNMFLLVGYLRWAQVALGVLAVVVGGIHIKDFFALGRGVSLSIPESAKPGIYARVRKIVTAEHLWGAILGAAILAVLVNVIELLCTAGLPALYTQILTLKNLPLWQNYAYLGLYNVAYMFDDSLMVAVVVLTLGRRKLQEQQGRWLKLISGLVIAVLGLVLLFKPDWLV